LAAVASGKPLVIFGDGESRRDYIYIDDVVRMVEGIAELDVAPEVVNIGTQASTTLNEVIAAVERCLNVNVERSYREARRSDLRSIVLDVSLVRSLTGVDPVSLEEGIRLTVLEADR
jgi:UDP-glucose 4-epimerase